MNYSFLDELVSQELWETIGKGAYGEVFLAAFVNENENGETEHVAVKRLSLSSSVFDIEAETAAAKRLMNCKHPNLPVIHSVFKHYHFLYIVMEYYPEGDLSTIFKNFPHYHEGHVQSIVRQIVNALEFLLEKNMVHRDIKLDNILVKSWEPIKVALTDFNFSKVLVNKGRITALKTSLGTVGFKAPEVYKRNGTTSKKDLVSMVFARNMNEKYDFTCDVWSLGCVMYCLLSGGLLPFKLPPDDVRDEEQDTEYYEKRMKVIVTGDKYHVRFDPATRWFKVSQEAKDLLGGVNDKGVFTNGMLIKNAENRCTYTDIIASNWMKIDFNDPPQKGWPLLYDGNQSLTVEERKQLMDGSTVDN